MDDAEYKKLWAMIDSAHTRIGRLEGEREMLMRALNDLTQANDSTVVRDMNTRIALSSAKRLLETMKGE